MVFRSKTVAGSSADEERFEIPLFRGGNAGLWGVWITGLAR